MVRPLAYKGLRDSHSNWATFRGADYLALEVRRGMTAKVAGDVLAEVGRQRGAPTHTRSENGPGLIARAIRELGCRGPKPAPAQLTAAEPARRGRTESLPPGA
jgi:hypothetical protein